jgi:hypothetical protein
MTKAEQREAAEVLRRVLERIDRARLLRTGNGWWGRCWRSIGREGSHAAFDVRIGRVLR